MRFSAALVPPPRPNASFLPPFNASFRGANLSAPALGSEFYPYLGVMCTAFQSNSDPPPPALPKCARAARLRDSGAARSAGSLQPLAAAS